jgi:F-type H+-transporting ATPase subunit epsilon
MAQDHTFSCNLITPERKVLECEAKFVAFPAHDGEVGILPHRAPLVYKLGIGPMRIDAVDGRHVFLIDGGFAQMVDNRLTVLTEQAKKAEDVDLASANRAMADARAMRIKDDATLTARDKAVRRAQAQLKIAGSK